MFCLTRKLSTLFSDRETETETDQQYVISHKVLTLLSLNTKLDTVVLFWVELLFYHHHGTMVA